ncbi:RICIN domain-containing protein [Streptomyces sp. NPDC091027]|uniref:RICIN domain-containing protein n=1 Tax=Streptomyces sp. NPDC091027 TaxID=3365971 RepID=UPI0037F453EB
MSVLRRSGALGGAFVAALGLAIIPATSASADFPRFERFENKASGKCLEVADWSTANNAVVRQWACTEGANQKWDLVAGSYVNRHSGKCLEVADWSTARGAVLRQWDCTSGSNQKWEAFSCDSRFACFYANVNSGHVMEIGGYSTSNGARAVQWPYNRGDNQRWYP